jgi:hypothetical protein
VLCIEGGNTFVTSIFESGCVALNGFEGFLSAFYVLFVVVPFCGFFCEARVVDVLICHGFGRLAESSLCTRSSMLLGLYVWDGGGCGVDSAMLRSFGYGAEGIALSSLPDFQLEGVYLTALELVGNYLYASDYVVLECLSSRMS